METKLRRIGKLRDQKSFMDEDSGFSILHFDYFQDKI